MAKRKKKELFIIVAGETPYLGIPEDREEMAETNDFPDLPTTLKEAQSLLKRWDEWDEELGEQDAPFIGFKIYKLVEVK